MAADKKTLLRNALKFVQKGQLDKAIEAYKAVVAADPRDVKVQNALGDLFIRQGRKKEGIAAYVEVAKLYEQDKFAHRAIAICQKILNLDPAMTGVRLKLGDLYTELKLPAEARGHYLQVAEHFDKKGDVSSALDVFRKIADLDPENLAVRVKLAGMFEKQKFPEKAAEEYVRTARGYREKGETATAVELFQRALRLHSASFGARRGLAEHHAGRKEWAMVIQALDPLMARETRETDLVLLYAEACAHQGRRRDAVTMLRKARELEPNDVPLNTALGRMLLGDGDVEGGVEALNRCVGVHVAEHRLERAEAVLREMAGAAPDDDRIRQRILEVQQKRDDRDGVAASYLELAAIYERRGLVRNAVGNLEKYLELRPGDAAAASRIERMRTASPAPPPATPPPPEPEPEPLPELGVEEVLEIDLEDDELSVEAVGAAQEADEVEIDVEGGGEEPPEERPTTLGEARASIESGAPGRAAEFLRDHLEGSPADIEARELLCEALRCQGDRRGQRDALYELGEVHREAGRTDEARRAYQQVLDADPRHLPAAEALADLAVSGGRDEEPVAEPPHPGSEGELEGLDEVFVELEGFDEDETAPAADGGDGALSLEALEESSAPLPGGEPAGAPDVPPGEPDAVLEKELDEAFEEAFDREGDAEREAAEPHRDVEGPPGVPPGPGPAAEAGPLVEEDEISLEGYGEGFSFPGAEAPGAGAGPPSPPERAGAVEASAPGVPGAPDVEESLAEADFYFQQGLLDEAEFLYAKILRLAPGDGHIAARLERIAQLRGASAAETAPGRGREAPETVPDEALGAESGQAAPRFEPERAGSGPGGVDFGDFMSDLRREIESEVASVPPQPPPGGEGDDLAEIFQEFQRSVKEQLGDEDFETHYNLGIAYKEMGLMEEALGDFTLAERSPTRRLDALSMIAVCLREKGRFDEAAAKLREGIAVATEGSDQQKGFLYDIAGLHEHAGRTEEARAALARINGVDPAYRDVPARLAALGGPATPPEPAVVRKKPKVSYL